MPDHASTIPDDVNRHDFRPIGTVGEKRRHNCGMTKTQYADTNWGCQPVRGGSSAGWEATAADRSDG